MKCPACSRELKEWLVGTIAVDVCDGGCGGIWFDAFELQKIEQASKSVTDQLKLILRDETAIVDPGLKRSCPRCAGVKLKRQLFSPKHNVHVDLCPGCGGYWLDYGELSMIHAANKSARMEGTDQQGISMDVIRFLYRVRTRNAADASPPLS